MSIDRKTLEIAAALEPTNAATNYGAMMLRDFQAPGAAVRSLQTQLTLIYIEMARLSPLERQRNAVRGDDRRVADPYDSIMNRKSWAPFCTGRSGKDRRVAMKKGLTL